jgi:flagellar biosynthesis protein
MEENQDPPSPYAPLKPSGKRPVAVAVRGNAEKPESLPQITASGRGKLAEEIPALAFARGVKVREDSDLAELLAKLDLDTPIPSEAIVAVAEILAKVYEANARMIAPAGPSSPHGNKTS